MKRINEEMGVLTWSRKAVFSLQSGGVQAIYWTASCWDWVLTQVNGQGKRARRMVKWEIDKCYECLLSYLFRFLFVHCTHWKFACCETVALYCVKVLRICKSYSFSLRSYLFGRICECNVFGKVEFCIKNASWVFQPGTLVCIWSACGAESLKRLTL